eukprot:SAG31_NODE_4764_length_2972_cov_2.026801_1_plen_105_part_00
MEYSSRAGGRAAGVRVHTQTHTHTHTHEARVHGRTRRYPVPRYGVEGLLHRRSFITFRYKALEKQRWKALLEPLELEISAIAQVRHCHYRPVRVRIPNTSVVPY